MSKNKQDILADIKPVDKGEPLGIMEPVILGENSKHRASLAELVFDLTKRASGFQRSLPNGVHQALVQLVRSMNCYYSNLIEGHNTHPIDIERALHNDYSSDTRKRDLQLEAKAHIEVQTWIEEDGLRAAPTSIASILEIHRRFCENLPEDLLWVPGDLKEKNSPGEFRKHDVRVGQHIAISPGSIERFLKHFETTFGRLRPGELVLNAAAAHHRFLWIHPFLDGNGRVARLMSHAMLLSALETGGVWSVSRGLARNVQAYKSHLANCDLKRRNDLDGRGNLSEEALAEFTKFFLEICIDQVKFMETLIEPVKLHRRMISWANEETSAGNLPAKASLILEAILFRGELMRSEIPALLGDVSERHARRLVSALIQSGVVASDSSRAALRLCFPARLAGQFTPGLFP